MGEILVSKTVNGYVAGTFKKNELTKEQVTRLHKLGFRREIVPFLGYQFTSETEPAVATTEMYGQKVWLV